MPNTEILLFADAVLALMFAASFLIAYAMNRSLIALLWWGVAFILFAIPFTATSMFAEAAGWICLFTATSLVVLGMHRVDEDVGNLGKPIIVGAGALALIVIASVVLSAPLIAWIIIAAMPALFLAGWSTFVLVRRKPRDPFRWGYGVALVATITQMSIRAIWLADPELVANCFAAFGVNYIDETILISIDTIVAIVFLGTMLTTFGLLAMVGKFRERARRDAMTGLLNRGAFDEQANQLLANSEKVPVCAILLDIDHFKQVNDTYGHLTGDSVIATLGAIISETTAEQHIAGRIGGEEFAVILPDTVPVAARLIAEAIRTRLSACHFGTDVTFSVTISAGVALRAPHEPLHTVLVRADQALYEAKRKGRDRVVLAPFPEVSTGPRKDPAPVKQRA